MICLAACSTYALFDAEGSAGTSGAGLLVSTGNITLAVLRRSIRLVKVAAGKTLALHNLMLSGGYRSSSGDGLE